jgi:hypothetical protein
MIRWYPRGWQARYGDEFDQLLRDLEGRPGRVRLAWDVARGALDAQLRGRYGMKRFLADVAVRRGFYDGTVVAVVIAVDVVLSNVIFPPGPDESDSNPEYLVHTLAIYAVLGLLLVLIGARGRRRTGDLGCGARAGAVAGAVVGAVVSLTFLVMDNLFFSIVSQQHDKRVAFARSGWGSMGAFLTVDQLLGALFLIPALGLVGAGLGLLGAALAGSRAATTATG